MGKVRLCGRLVAACVLALALAGFGAVVPAHAGGLLSGILSASSALFGGDDASSQQASEEATAFTFESAGEEAAFNLLSDAIGRLETGEVDARDADFTVGELRGALALVEIDPELDIYAGCSYSYRNDDDNPDDCTVTKLTLSYVLDESELATYDEVMAAALDEAVTAIEPQLEDAASEEEVVLAIHDYLVDACTHDSVLGREPSYNTAYAALVYGGTGNHGYASAFCRIAQRLGLEARIVCDEGGISWNLVEVDGVWYHLDVCWDDVENDENGAYTSYQYYLVDDATMLEAHDPWDGVPAVERCWATTVYGETDEGRLAYARVYFATMLGGLETDRTGIDRFRFTVSDVKTVLAELSDDPSFPYSGSHNMLFHCASSNIDAEGIVYELSVGYQVWGITSEDYWANLDAAADQLVAEASACSSDYEKVLYVHDWLVRHCSYGDITADVDHTAYGALVNGWAVCDGYANACTLVLQRLGIDCVKVVSEDMDHSWNMVCLDGAWYHLDACWDDPTPDQGPDAQVSHENFLRSDAGIQATGHYGWVSPYEASRDYSTWW